MRLYNLIALILFSSVFTGLQAQEKSSVTLRINYYTHQNLPYLVAKAKTKINGKLSPVPGLVAKYYIYNATGDTVFLGSAAMDFKGESLLYVPASAQAVFQSQASLHFMVVTASNKQYDEGSGEVTVQKSKLIIDTLDGRKAVATLLVKNDTGWIPMKGVELTLGVQRLDGILPINSTATASTDSLGMVTGDYAIENLPGDKKGILTLVASIKDNEVVGSIESGINVPWGAPAHFITNHFFDRTLFARRGQSPIWLEILAYSMVAMVWGVVIYLLVQLRKIIRIGKSAAV